MMNLVERRKRSGMSQFLCAQRSGISRMRLSLAETGQVVLTAAEQSAIDRALKEYIVCRAQEIKRLLKEQEPEHVATSIAL
jgi:transcriptional regulator with XRE-family HTH domain